MLWFDEVITVIVKVCVIWDVMPFSVIDKNSLNLDSMGTGFVIPGLMWRKHTGPVKNVSLHDCKIDQYWIMCTINSELLVL
jgi:hypothetical protein